jgi:hypothetical protein
MKNLVCVFYIYCVLSVFISCKKGKEVTAKPSIQGMWSLVSETAIQQSEAAQGPDTIAVKILPTDYYNFAANGILYINEQNAGGRDTVNYKVLTDSTISVYYFQNNKQIPWGNGVFYVETLTANKMKIYWPDTMQLPFLFRDTINFKRE